MRVTEKIPFPLSKIGYGTFKLGRNTGTKYSTTYELPTVAQCRRILDQCLELGINYFDTAPAYGIAEERVGEIFAGRTDVLVSTKAGELFDGTSSTYDFSRKALTASVESSLGNLQRDTIDIVFLHCNYPDIEISRASDAPATLLDLKRAGKIRLAGFSALSVEGAEDALSWTDALMVEYNTEDRRFEPVIAEAFRRGISIFIKKAFGSGKLDAAASLRFLIRESPVRAALSSVLVTTLNPEHLRSNVAALHAEELVPYCLGAAKPDNRLARKPL